MNMSFWNGKRVLVTGNTGFKGSWLSLWLQKLGACVTGYALEAPTKPSMFDICKLAERMPSIIGDIRDGDRLKETVESFKPEIVFHLAAQPIVRKSYINPVETFEVNIMGTVNLFEAIKNSDSVRVVVNVTSDKCYDNKEWVWGYRENDPVGGRDPYSCSKGCSELITKSYRESFFRDRGIALSSARAGNVIGGGDWAEDRLIPDIVRSILKNSQYSIRNPKAIRPWQHVLEPLNGYMILAEKMWCDMDKYSEAWNFGPDEDHFITVEELAQRILILWGKKKNLTFDGKSQIQEAQILKLDSSKSKSRLGWMPKLSIEDTLLWTVDWYRNFAYGRDMIKESLRQIAVFEGMGNKQTTRI